MAKARLRVVNEDLQDQLDPSTASKVAHIARAPGIQDFAYIVANPSVYRYRGSSVLWAGVYHSGETGYYGMVICNQERIYVQANTDLTDYSECARLLRTKLRTSSNQIAK